MSWPITLADVRAARDRLAPFLVPTPLRRYPSLEAAVGHGIEVWVKHQNHQPTSSFKIRNGLSAVTALSDEQRTRGVIAATRGNHGQGVAYAARLVGAPVTICVPVGNSPSKNQAMRDLGATVVEEGRDYDEYIEVAKQLVAERGLYMVHSTNDATIIAGAGTMTLEILEQMPSLDTLVVAVGGGSQSVGALTVARKLKPSLEVYGVQAANASAIHDSYHAKQRIEKTTAATFADGLATRKCYDLTFDALCEGLTDFVTATEAELASAVRLIIATTHNLVEGAGAAGVAGLIKLAPRLAGRRVGVVLSGANIDDDVLRRVLNHEL